MSAYDYYNKRRLVEAPDWTQSQAYARKDLLGDLITAAGGILAYFVTGGSLLGGIVGGLAIGELSDKIRDWLGDASRKRNDLQRMLEDYERRGLDSLAAGVRDKLEELDDVEQQVRNKQNEIRG